MSKTESRFKSKLESLKKFQHSASTNTAVEKARAFFRSLELKHIGGSTERISFGSSFRRRPIVVESTSNKRSNLSSKIPLPASSSKCPVSSSISSSSSSSIIDDSHTLSTLDSTSNHLNSSDGITTAKIIQVRNPNHSNPKDMIVHRVIDNEEDFSLRTFSYSSGQYKHLTSPVDTRIHSPKHYQYGISNERSHSYSASMDRKREIRFKYDCQTLSPIISLQHSNMTNSGPMYYPSAPSSNRSSLTQGDLSDQPICTSLYRHRPLVYRQNHPSSLMSSSFHEQSHRIDPIIRPLSSSVSTSLVSSWSQSVRRLNLEYASTVNALQKAKQSLEQVYPQPTAETVSKYANLVARGINDLSKSNDQESKSSLGTSFCITAPIQESVVPSKIPARSMKIVSATPVIESPPAKANIFTKPKVIRPKELNTFTPSMSLNPPKLEPVFPSKNPKECSDSIANIIKKFNSLNKGHSDGKGPSNIDRNDVHFPAHQNQKASHNSLSQTIICDSVCKTNGHSNGSSVSESILKALNSPPNRLPPPIPNLLEKKYELEEIPYESPSALTSSSSTSSFSEDSTSSKTSSVDGNHINTPDHGETNLPEETTYTVETFYKPLVECDSILPSHQQSELVVIRENATEEQFIMAQKKQMDPVISHRFTVNESCVPPLTTPLLTYFNLPGKQTGLIESEEKNNENNYQSTESSARLSIGNGVCSQDDETINDIITSNPHTNSSSSSSSSSHRLISSSSTTSTGSSTSTVLLSATVTQTQKSTPSQIKIPDSIKDQSSTVIQPTVSQIPKRTPSSTLTNGSRLKPPSKTISPPSKLKPTSSTGSKSTKTMITNNTTAMTTSTRKATGAMNQSLPMSNSIANKSIQQQTSNSNSSSTKKIPTTNGTNMTESALLTDSSMNTGKNRVRSMVNQLNAASRSTVTSSTSDKRIPTLVNGRRPSNMDTSNNLSTSISTSKPTVTPTNRPTLQRAMTINHNGSIAPTSSMITPPSTNNNLSSTYKRKAPLIRSTSNVKEGLLRWCQSQVAGYPNVSVTNLSSSWADGLAFCALTHHFFPNAFDYNSLSANNRKENFELAFRVAEEQAGVPQLLDVSDMLIMGNTPDYKCIFTYLNSFLAKVKDLQPTTNGIEHH